MLPQWMRKKRDRRQPRKAKFSDRWPAVITKEGKGFLWLTLGVAFAALNTGNNLIYLVLSFMLSLLLLSMILAEGGIRSLDVKRLRIERVFASEPASVRYTIVSRRKWLPVFAVEIRERHAMLAQEQSAWVAKVGVSQQEVSAQVLIAQRGTVTLRDIQVRTSFPFGLVEKRRWFRQPQNLVVYPKPGARGADLRSLPRSLGEQRVNRGARTEQGELREYVPGDPVRSIHWRRSAALGELVSREHVPQGRPELLLDLADGLPARTDENWRKAVEIRIQQATRVVLDAEHDGTPVALRYGTEQAKLAAEGSSRPALRFLAQLEPETS